MNIRTMTRKDFVRLLGSVTAVPMLPSFSFGATKKDVAISFRSSINRIDPAFTISGDEYAVTQAIYDNLVRLGPDLQAKPGLAESWETIGEADHWRFKLRSGVRFHSGRNMDAEDVVYSIRRILDKATGSAGRNAIGPIETVTAAGPNVVEFKLTSPLADFPLLMTQTFARIVPKDAGNLDTKPIGTGPFKFVNWMPGQQIQLTRNEDYWEVGTPKIDNVRFVTYPTQTGEQAALTSGQTHMMWDVPLSLIPVVSRLPGLVLEEVATTAFQPICMRSDRPPFDNPKVRLAMKHAINRELVTKIVLQGHGTIAQDLPVGQASPFFAGGKAPEYNPARARALLEEAGIKDLSLTLFATNERAGCLETAQVVKPMIEAIGVRVDIQQRPWDRFLAEVWKKENFFVGTWLGRITIDEQLYPFYHSSGSWNEYSYSNPEVDRLLDDARRATDLAKRKELYAKVQEILAFDGPAIIPYFMNYACAKSEKLKGVPPMPNKWVELRGADLVTS
ncbi:ABC transporter substrate-binding protein [Microvirga sp. VF16]|uniref:ABC transporter substrate-binding protein n=1 Tax=Microvirga sp. VF16 TaxID=2807101 RepID=UPI00193E5B16|nr:ABC transporter substrate-binding protein [Microvirga sp. VF16]QRM33116.1 ABC transporter substrate-binding protein [Microvirga sp. VF16]